MLRLIDYRLMNLDVAICVTIGQFNTKLVSLI